MCAPHATGRGPRGRSRLPLAVALAVGPWLLVAAAPVRGRTPPFVPDPREGVWFGAGERFVHQARDRFTVYPAGAQVNKLAVDDPVVWLATDDGVIRFDTQTRKGTRLTM